MIQASSRLVHFGCKTRTLTNWICEALLDHTNCLETLDLQLSFGTEDNTQNIRRILAHCFNLRLLRVKYGTNEDKLCLESLEGPWACANLQSLSLEGVTEPFGGDKSGAWGRGGKYDKSGGANHEPTEGMPPFQHDEDKAFWNEYSNMGWIYVPPSHPLYSRPPGQPTLFVSERALRDMVFERVGRLSEIHRINLEKFEYIRSNRISKECRRRYRW